MALHMWSCWLRRSFPKILAAIISAAAMKRYLGTITWVPLLGLFPFACLGKVSRGPGTPASITFRAQPGAKINGVFAVGGWLVAVSSDGYMAHKCMCYAWVFVGISLQLGGQIGPEESIVLAVIEPCTISRSQSHTPPVWLLFLLILLFSSSSPSPCHSTWVAFTLAF